MMVEVAQPNTLEEMSPSNIVTGVLRELTPQEKVAESESSDRNEPDNAPTVVLERNNDEG